jgi:hypothetical protein
VRFEVLTAFLLKIQVFWDVTLCLLDVAKDHSAFTFRVKQPWEERACYTHPVKASHQRRHVCGILIKAHCNKPRRYNYLI